MHWRALFCVENTVRASLASVALTAYIPRHCTTDDRPDA